ncbi:hypothetical protein FEM48_Zijuj08G0070100 [Ziziphus jujuba var. spinosa]|uniref:Exostosin GT47 domain-containing protein n=1 Tax=Ziziphus jujuba var. spinosa TaxID=714518 RepID=A0A978UXN2_ZIZJJ|nr:hypothetical protein FEM48_Zijuj08G0070100 [Ziziphus jujuba var. spinosa]
MKPPNKPSSSSSSYMWPSYSFMVLLLVLPLLLISILVFTLGEARYLSWPPWKADKLLGYTDAPLVLSTKRPSELLVAAQSPLTSSKPNETVLDLPQVGEKQEMIKNNETSITSTNVTKRHSRSYLEMEKLFKIYVYEEGDPPMFHDGPCKSIYSTEGRFIHEMEKGNKYRTQNPDEALIYFLPFSVVKMVQYLYVPDTRDRSAMKRAVTDYINIISDKHPFWNRSLGADHFMLSCHDWGPVTSSYVPHLFNKSIRVLCNANTSEGFNPSKDVSFPEIHLRTGEIKGLIGGFSPSRRPILAFFAGRLHGHIRYLLLEQWKGKDQDVQVYDQLPKGVSYDLMLKKSKFCLCPSGYEVASPRVVEAIYAECVPVLISDSYVPPFSDVLNWKSFSVQVQVKDIPNIKRILTGISQSQYLRMQRRVKQVQRHFVANGPPTRFDVFHMIVHSIWLRRLNVRIED